MLRQHTLIVSLLLGIAGMCRAEDASLRQEAARALRKATAFFCEEVSTEGGYLWRYSDDLKRREGEGKTDEHTVWLQPPGTPAVGMAFLEAYWNTGDRTYLDAALAAGDCLVRGQLRSGGWDNSITFDPERRGRYAYRVDEPVRGGSQRNTTTLDDNKTQSAIGLLVHLDATLGFENEAIHACALSALQGLLDAQYPNGAWPQRFSEPPVPEKFPVVKASYPDSWPRAFPKKSYGGYYTFNDNVMGDVIEVLTLAFSVYKDERYLRAVERAGDFILLAQMPDPQPAWAQQYDLAMHPAWARKFEPPSVTGGESQGIIRTLIRIYRETGKRRYLDAVPRAVAYLRRSELADGRLARFYELKTNRPLYFTTDYVLTYSDDDMPTHYSFKTGNGLAGLEKAYEQALTWRGADLQPKPYKRPTVSSRASARLVSQVRHVVDGLDDQGRWVEPGRLRYHGADDPTERILDCRTFINNCRLLSRYLASEPAP
jgi:pectate lyase-like protein